MAKKYGYIFRKGGLLIFEGVQMDGKQLKSAVRTDESGRTAVTITFDDDSEYKFDCIKNGKNISDVKEYWNNVPLYDYGEDDNNGSS